MPLSAAAHVIKPAHRQIYLTNYITKSKNYYQNDLSHVTCNKYVRNIVFSGVVSGYLGPPLVKPDVLRHVHSTRLDKLYVLPKTVNYKTCCLQDKTRSA